MVIPRAIRSFVIAVLGAVSACGHAVTPADTGTDAVIDVPTVPEESDDAPDAVVEACFPPCLESVFAQCPPTVPCVSQIDGTEAENYCYASGSTSRVASTSTEVHAVAYRPDGSLCFRFDATRGAAGMAGSGVFLDATGRVIATFSQSDQDLHHPTVTCAGVDYVVDTTRSVCADHYFAAVGPCTRGTCSVAP
jgi:hypothetical protein